MALFNKHLAKIVSWRPRRLKTMYFLSFVAIFLVPVTILIGNSMRTEINRQRNELHYSQQQALQEATTNLDTVITHLLVVANQMALDAELTQPNDSVTKSVDIINTVKRYDLSSAYIERSFVYLNSEPDTLYGADGTYDLTPSLYKYSILPPSTRSGNKLWADLLSSQFPKLLFLPEQAGDGIQITLAAPISKTRGDDHYGVAFFQLNGITVKQILQDVVTSNSQVLGMVGPNGHLILSQSKLAGVDLNSMPQQWEKLMGAAQQKNVTIRRTNGGGNLFQVVSYTSTPDSWSWLWRALIEYAGIIGVLVIVGGLLVWRFGRWQYSVVYRMEQLVPGWKNTSHPHQPELERFQNALESYVAAHQETLLEAKYSLPYVRNQVLQLVINGRVTDEDQVERLLNLAKIELPFTQFAVAIMTDSGIVNCESMPEPFSGKGFVSVTIHQSSQSQVIILVNYSAATDLNRALRAVRKQLLAPLPEAPLFVGQPVNSLTALQAAYIGAVSAQMASHPQNNQVINHFQLNSETNTGDDRFDSANELKLENSLATGQFNAARDAFENLFNLASQSYDPSVRFDLSMSNLINQVLTADYHRHGQVNEELVQQMLSMESLSQLRVLLLSVIQDVTGPNSKDEKWNHTDIATEIENYIVANAASPTLSLVDVADHFHFSVPYTSRYVKEITGKTFTAFVQDIRFDRIRLALQTTDLTIKQIVETNGYYDVASFTRKFKKIMGMTPGQYRQLSQPEIVHLDNSQPLENSSSQLH
ncbi:helix-turn-helix domain-containing protein [Schleiferilactobacillus shenzhenensis]|uniref:2-isopropylmalate synthase n=1 Tax=Schleiferilactobacillus shenzhenensis LY-73 TaxID=1231336 RepID=U4TSA2_9LACO|nr:helix-turn-helix domain-containing protein [Schleiferilactobacillus shenzhenensis]ERL64783.1 2-isopropylmalate synthase [Schleiferilactobacillus shenzhenensis LY-73]